MKMYEIIDLDRGSYYTIHANDKNEAVKLLGYVSLEVIKEKNRNITATLIKSDK